jgi:hypothetical protein
LLRADPFVLQFGSVLSFGHERLVFREVAYFLVAPAEVPAMLPISLLEHCVILLIDVEGHCDRRGVAKVSAVGGTSSAASEDFSVLDRLLTETVSARRVDEDAVQQLLYPALHGSEGREGRCGSACPRFHGVGGLAEEDVGVGGRNAVDTRHVSLHGHDGEKEDERKEEDEQAAVLSAT